MESNEKFPEDNKVKYIKLGDSNKYAKECFEKGYARLGYDSVPHELCEEGKWEEVGNIVSTKGKNNLKRFYEGSSETIWITFHNGCLYWTQLKENGTRKLRGENSYFKVRDCIDGWSNRSINGNLLEEFKISGELLQVKNYRGTMATPSGAEIAIKLINDTIPEKVESLQEKVGDLHDKVENVIGEFNENDFELLVDLIFRESGWQRRYQLGGTRENVDLDLIDPMSKKVAFVQVKTKSSLQDYLDFVENVKGEEDYKAEKYYFISSKPDEELIAHGEEFVEIGDEEIPIKLVTENGLSRLVVDLGLTSWIMEKVSSYY